MSTVKNQTEKTGPVDQQTSQMLIHQTDLALAIIILLGALALFLSLIHI